MDKNTIDDYKKGIKIQFEEAKNKEFSGFLFRPSPAELKILCLLLFDRGLSKQDQEIFDAFFQLDTNSRKRKQIEFFNVDRLKPISNFLRGKTEDTRIVCMDLIAVLVDFHPRPYRKFFIEFKKEYAIVISEDTDFSQDKRQT